LILFYKELIPKARKNTASSCTALNDTKIYEKRQLRRNRAWNTEDTRLDTMNLSITVSLSHILDKPISIDTISQLALY
jgi:hypothetical protein